MDEPARQHVGVPPRARADSLGADTGGFASGASAGPGPELMALRVTTPDGSARSLAEHLAVIPVDALVVLHGDAFIFEWYAPGVAPTDQHIVFSVTKSITGLLAGALAGDARLDLDVDVVRYRPGASTLGLRERDGSAPARHVGEHSLRGGLQPRRRHAAIPLEHRVVTRPGTDAACTSTSVVFRRPGLTAKRSVTSRQRSTRSAGSANGRPGCVTPTR